jgi:hypothetical protein
MVRGLEARRRAELQIMQLCSHARPLYPVNLALYRSISPVFREYVANESGALS